MAIILCILVCGAGVLHYAGILEFIRGYGLLIIIISCAPASAQCFNNNCVYNTVFNSDMVMYLRQ